MKFQLKIVVLAVAIAATTIATFAAENPTGKWKWSFTTQQGQTFETTLTLKLDGDKLVGTVTGRSGTETAIDDAKLDSDTVSFSVTRDRQGQKFTTKYSGKISGDTIKGKSTSDRGERDWEAKRVKE